ncbi:MAG: methyltransferase domain-containing protein [Fervidobacterium sp.]|uniref:Glycosyl transferases group 1 n=1 Tax=Fervidobacterium gondwanense DSM 13020 TaxID=1121883 RepID=A0A1M7THJ6_FERGO|nr:methyltransferase domain-containing protein [Fervidobacterium gondwanense]SHN70249.1 Glycosyl transferases group 1 [Fervidobacterium gondwanense DSM 13020]
MRIHDKDWAVYDLLGDTQLSSGNIPMALKYYSKAAQLTDNPEMKNKFMELYKKEKKDTKIAFLCLPVYENFLKDIAEVLSLTYDTKLVVTEDIKTLQEAVRWADIIWLEWANEMAIFVTKNIPELSKKKVICRLHSYEALTDFPERIDWTKIDHLIFVAKHTQEIFRELHKTLDIPNVKEHVISNGIDLDRFKFTLHKPGYNLAVAAIIGHKKDPTMWIQLLAKLKRIDKNYKLHIAGEFENFRYKVYFNYSIKEVDLEENMILHGWVKDIEKFLEDKNFVLSTSIHEGHPYNIMEGMARGIKPIILNYRGAKEQWPNDLIYNTLDEALEIITNKSYDSESYRAFVELNYSLEKQIVEIYRLIKSIDDKTYNTQKTSVSVISNKDVVEDKNKENLEKAKSADEIKDYYDNFLERLKYDHIRENPRHSRVKDTLSKLVRPYIKVLDIGCGTGITSYFMASKGAIVTAIDLSDKLIEFAKQNSYHSNITYIVADATKLELNRSDFDLITIVDSMEHIPQNIVNDLFKVIKNHSNSSTVIYLNIPDARYQTFLRNNYPDRLQIVDETYYLDFLFKKFGEIGFEPIYVNIYGLDVPYQYDEIVFVTKEYLENTYNVEFSKYK